MTLLGCTGDELVEYLESKFSPGMSWGNRKLWHIDVPDVPIGDLSEHGDSDARSRASKQTCFVGQHLLVCRVVGVSLVNLDVFGAELNPGGDRLGKRTLHALRISCV
jgi:hypothetical protein